MAAVVPIGLTAPYTPPPVHDLPRKCLPQRSKNNSNEQGNSNTNNDDNNKIIITTN